MLTISLPDRTFVNIPVIGLPASIAFAYGPSPVSVEIRFLMILQIRSGVHVLCCRSLRIRYPKTIRRTKAEEVWLVEAVCTIHRTNRLQPKKKKAEKAKERNRFEILCDQSESYLRHPLISTSGYHHGRNLCPWPASLPSCCQFNKTLVPTPQINQLHEQNTRPNYRQWSEICGRPFPCHAR